MIHNFFSVTGTWFDICFCVLDYQQPHYYVGDSGRCTRDDCGDGSTFSLIEETNKRPWVDSHTAR